MSKKRKKLLMTPMGALAMVLAMAATAWACTVWKGTMTVKGNHPSSGSVTVEGLRVGMTQTVSSQIAKSTATAGSFTVKTGTGADNNKLPHLDANGAVKKYYVKFFNSGTEGSGNGYTNHTNWNADCMAGGPGVLLGSVTLNANGQIVSVTYAGTTAKLPVVAGTAVSFTLANGLNKDTSPAESAACISDPGAAYGNQAPLTIV